MYPTSSVKPRKIGKCMGVREWYKLSWEQRREIYQKYGYPKKI